MPVLTTNSGDPALRAGDRSPCCEGEFLIAWPYPDADHFCPSCGQLYAATGERVDA